MPKCRYECMSISGQTIMVEGTDNEPITDIKARAVTAFKNRGVRTSIATVGPAQLLAPIPSQRPTYNPPVSPYREAFPSTIKPVDPIVSEVKQRKKMTKKVSVSINDILEIEIEKDEPIPDKLSITKAWLKIFEKMKDGHNISLPTLNDALSFRTTCNNEDFKVLIREVKKGNEVKFKCWKKAKTKEEKEKMRKTKEQQST